MDPDPIIVITVTTPPDLAHDIARKLVDERLAACVNIIPEVTSVYRWQDKIEEDQECMLQVKTTATLFEAVNHSVREVHPYAVPEILSVTTDKGFESYLRWVKETVGKLPEAVAD